ncbi:MAG: TetR family transcriptional regulator C-terminal domain-containing protein [Eubacteriaceae bacterium]|nr:TetR family transcriptional regulator C-terminal domain-containing protein [Eubacteriaceae bacterium]
MDSLKINNAISDVATISKLLRSDAFAALQLIRPILYHIRESKANLKVILGGESGELFVGFLKRYLCELFLRYTDEFMSEIPEDLLLQYLSGSFAETIKWWMKEDTKHTPEEVARYYMTLIGK